MKKLNVVFVRPSNQNQVYSELSDLHLTGIEPPLWAALLTAFTRQLIVCDNVTLLDEVVEDCSHDKMAVKIRSYKPDLVVIVVSGTNPSASTPVMPAAFDLATSLREHAGAAKIMLLGLHPTALPEKTLMQSCADFICIGEGFYTLFDLLSAMSSDDVDCGKIRGLCYYKKGALVTERCPAVEPISRLPEPAWDDLDLSRYRAHNWHCFDDLTKRQPYATVYTSLGCPFSCSFCCINSFFGKPGIRYRTPVQVANEIDKLVKNQGVRNIKFIDEMFALNDDRVIDVCNYIYNLKHNLNIWAYARVSTVSSKQLEHMRKAGIRWLAYGIESGDDKILGNVDKRLTMNTTRDVMKMTRESGISICANYIFGLPGDDHDSMKRTLDLAKELNAEWANFYSVIPYPGSRLYDQAVTLGQASTHWQDYSQYSRECHPLPTERLTGDEILAFRDHAFKDYFSSNTYLTMLTKKFGEQASRHVVSMLKHEIKR